MPSEPEAWKVAREVASELFALPGVRAVALGGSQATAQADAASDIDLYVFGEAEAPVARRREMAVRRAVPGTAEIDNRQFGPGDEWLDRAGMGVDAMHWRTGWIEGEVAAVMERHEPRVGHTTALVHTIAVARPLHDPEGWFAALAERARAPYPEALARAIVAHNLPLLAAARHSFAAQIALAAARGDAVSVNHRTAAWIASAFDVLFALNRRLHPGEKRLLEHAGTLDRAPPTLARDVAALLAARGRERAAIARALARELEALARPLLGQPFTAPSERRGTR